MNMKHTFHAEAESLTSAGISGNGGDTLLDLDLVNNLNFDEMESAPGFVTPPDGIYILTLTSAKAEKYMTKDTPEKKGEPKARITHFFNIDKVLELSNHNEQEPPVGSKFSIRFQINENGLKFWKSHTKDILGAGAEGSNLTVAAVLKELNSGSYSFKARVKQKKSDIKDGRGNVVPGKTFTNIQVQVLEAAQDVEKGQEGVSNEKAI